MLEPVAADLLPQPPDLLVIGDLTATVAAVPTTTTGATHPGSDRFLRLRDDGAGRGADGDLDVLPRVVA
jgi:hypothetical protein